jgi:purine nucleosidase/pyrimidine-specific ribonucleoside hydrolase
MAVLFDDDGSPDGTAALFYLLSDPRVSVASISISFGEAYPAVYIQHLARKLDELDIEGIPLGAGQSAPLAGDNEFPEALRQGANNFWGLPIPNRDRFYPAVEAGALMASVVRQAPGPVTLFVSGPCTNLAMALRLDQGIRDNIDTVFIMGGAVYVPGNIDDLLPNSDNVVAEWNIYADPQAAQEVLQSGLDVYLVPLDATNQVAVTMEDVRAWRSGGSTADFAADIYEMLLTSWGVPRAAIWDLMTAALMVDPKLCPFQPLHLQVVTEGGATSGQTVALPDREANAYVCLEPDPDSIRRALAEVFSTSP